MAEKIGYYIVDLDVSTGLIGAPTLHLKLGVNAVTGIVQGSGEITRAFPPPHGVIHIPHIKGVIHHYGKDTLLVSLHGEYLHSNPPSTVVYEVKVTAALGVDAAWNGSGVFTDGSHIYNDCKVINVTDERAAPRAGAARQEHTVSSN
jgi:hypothetical protein